MIICSANNFRTLIHGRRRWQGGCWYNQANNLIYNDRIVNNYWQHDADGRVTQSAWPDDYTHTTYDARGLISVQNTYPNSGNQSIIERFYNGDGREVKRKKQQFVEDPISTSPPFGSCRKEGVRLAFLRFVGGGYLNYRVRS